MIKGSIVEYIDQQKIIAAVILQEKKGKLGLLNENNREVTFSEKRLTHISENCLDTTGSRESITTQLKTIAQNRNNLSKAIDIKELWELLHEESEDIELSTMTVFCFDPPVTSDHEAAVIRAFFKDKLYFKSNSSIFTPFTREQVENRKFQMEKAKKLERLTQQGAAWINNMLNQKNGSQEQIDKEIVEILTSYYLFNNDSPSKLSAKNMIKNSVLNSPEQLFQVFVKAGIWDQHENTAIHSLQIPTSFPDGVLEQTRTLAEADIDFSDDPLRTDLTHIEMITIDGQSTLDFDDALSLEKTDSGYRLGIHIIDVDAFIKPGDPIDQAAMERGSSIYMPDNKLPMLPSDLSENLCSLKEDTIRPGISTLVNMNRFFEIQDVNISASIIKVHKQMSYTEANLMNGQDDPITTLYKMATVLREKRLKSGAIQITLPEVNVWIEENNDIGYAKIDRENPSRMLVSEMMILANTLMAKFLADHDMPAVFRSQTEPSQRLFRGIETSLILNFMQRKHLSRAVIGTDPRSHAGLGVSAYATATSPIRRYHDLLTQRQIKAILGYDNAYAKDTLEQILQGLAMTIANAGKVQAMRKRYWIIRYLESMRGSTYEALVLDAYRDHYNVLIKEFMLETKLSKNGIHLKAGDIIQVTIQHADARREQLSLLA